MFQIFYHIEGLDSTEAFENVPVDTRIEAAKLAAEGAAKRLNVPQVKLFIEGTVSFKIMSNGGIVGYTQVTELV